MQKGLKLSLATGLICLSLACCGLVAYRSISKVGFIPIEVVAFTESLHYEDPDLIRRAVSPLIQKGFFACDVQEVKQRLETLPWIARADVQRKWPNRLQISLIEHKPLALWEERGIIDVNGRLFFPQTVANITNLPQFIGDRERVSEMVDIYSLANKHLQSLELVIEELSLLSDQGWKLVLDNGLVVILGQKELVERLQRFVLAYTSKLRNEHEHIRVVDLRYTNGLAVG